MTAHAECGGSQECIAVSIDASPPAHGTPETSAPIAFGAQTAATTSAPREVRVGAVTGPPGTRATIQSITITGANAADFRVSSTSCTVGTPSLLHDGGAQAAPENTCGISVVFSPAAAGDKNAALRVASSAITRIVPLTGTGTAALAGPGAGAATLEVPINQSATIDLAPFITGIVTGVAVVTRPEHGTTTVAGTRVTYTPTRDYFGPDTFTYAAFNAAGSSTPAAVTVTVTGRPNPARDPNVIGLVNAQAQAAQRFSTAQISNFQQRLEHLHAGAFGGVAAGDSDATRSAYAGNAARSSAAFPKLAGVGRWQPSDVTLWRPDHDPFALHPASDASDGMSGQLLTSLVTTALADGGGDGASRTSAAGTTGFWIGGNLNFGTRGDTAVSRGVRFRTDGLSIGFDRRVSDRLVLGAGVGFARDRTDIGIDGTMTRSRGFSLALYGSYKPTREMFVDGLLGYGRLRHDSDRFVPAVNDYARFRDRDSDQFFGSLAAGYELRRDGVLLSPYGRVDVSVNSFETATESGAGANALTYFDNTSTTVRLALGLRAESRHRTRFGLAVPRVRGELGQTLEANRDVTIGFADQVGGVFSLAPPGSERTWVLAGVGTDFIFRNGLIFGVDYLIQRTTGEDRNHSVRLYLRKEIDGKGPALGAVSSGKLFENPVRVEAGYMWDENLTRASSAADRRSDHIYFLSATKTTTITLAQRLRAMLSGFVNGEKLYTYDGLDRFGFGARGELQFRTSAAFSAPTFALFTRVWYDEYHSDIRSGYRYQYGVSARQSWTDRIDAFAALTWTERHSRDDVFDASEYGGRFNLDYGLGRYGVAYAGGEWRNGDIVTTVGPGTTTGLVAKASTPDDAFGAGTQLTAHRLEGTTVIWTLGYNYPLGPRDSIDLSWRHVTSRNFVPESVAALYQATRYTTNQYSIAYLLRF